MYSRYDSGAVTQSIKRCCRYCKARSYCALWRRLAVYINHLLVKTRTSSVHTNVLYYLRYRLLRPSETGGRFFIPPEGGPDFLTNITARPPELAQKPKALLERARRKTWKKLAIWHNGDSILPVGRQLKTGSSIPQLQLTIAIVVVIKLKMR